jgi:hypothetical protein
MNPLRIIRYPLLAGVLLLLVRCTADNPSPSPADPRDSFTGSWMVTESGQKITYQVVITLDPTSSTNVLIANFADAGSGSNPAVAVVSGTTITLIANQTVGDGWVINGGGSLSGSNKINWTYTLNDGATLQHLTAVYTRI